VNRNSFVGVQRRTGALVCLLFLACAGLPCGSWRACAQEASGQGAAQGALPDSASSETATATPSRAARWRQKRRAKAQTLTPPEPGFFDRVGRLFARTSGAVVPRRFIVTVPQLGVAGFHPVLGGLSENAGMTAGVLYKPPFSQAEH